MPYAASLEQASLPTAKTIVDTVKRLLMIENKQSMQH